MTKFPALDDRTRFQVLVDTDEQPKSDPQRRAEDALDRLLQFGYRRIDYLCRTVHPGFFLNKQVPTAPGPQPQSPPPPVFLYSESMHRKLQHNNTKNTVVFQSS